MKKLILLTDKDIKEVQAACNQVHDLLRKFKAARYFMEQDFILIISQLHRISSLINQGKKDTLISFLKRRFL